MSRTTQFLISAALAVLVNALAAVSLADTPGTTANQHSFAVHYSDLSLDRPADVARLYQRISRAADNACGPRELTGAHIELTAYRSCFDAAVGKAVAAVASPALSAYYREQLAASHTHATTLAQR
jgi:UrcA family protein